MLVIPALGKLREENEKEFKAVLQLHSEVEASLDYRRSCHKNDAQQQ